MSKEMWENVRIFLSKCTLNMNQCKGDYITCGICRKVMINACQIACRCRFCRQCMENYLREGWNHCPVGATDDCVLVALGSMDDVQMESECNNVILKLRVHCPIEGCDVEGELKNMVDHLEECMKMSKKVSERRNDEIGVKNLGKNAQELEILMVDTNKRMESLEKMMQNEHARIGTLIGEISMVSKRVEDDKYNDFIWKIDDYSRIRELGSYTYSAPFYTRKNGYKLRMKFFANGDDDRGTDMSLYFQVMCGEYDDTLPWPFQYDVTFSILDQEGHNRDHVSTLKYPPLHKYLNSYHKPDMGNNLFYGFPRFLEISRLYSNNFLIKNNVVYLRCSARKV